MNIESDASNQDKTHHRSVLKQVNNKTKYKVRDNSSRNRFAALEEEDIELTDGTDLADRTDVVKYGIVKPIVRKIPAAE